MYQNLSRTQAARVVMGSGIFYGIPVLILVLLLLFINQNLRDWHSQAIIQYQYLGTYIYWYLGILQRFVIFRLLKYGTY